MFESEKISVGRCEHNSRVVALLFRGSRYSQGQAYASSPHAKRPHADHVLDHVRPKNIFPRATTSRAEWHCRLSFTPTVPLAESKFWPRRSTTGRGCSAGLIAMAVPPRYEKWRSGWAGSCC